MLYVIYIADVFEELKQADTWEIIRLTTTYMGYNNLRLVMSVMTTVMEAIIVYGTILLEGAFYENSFFIRESRQRRRG